MDMNELLGLIELHNVYDKHTPHQASKNFGIYKTHNDGTLCESCGLPYIQAEGFGKRTCAVLVEGTKDSLASEIVRRIHDIYQHVPVAFTEFLSICEQKDIGQGYADIILSSSIVSHRDRWRMLRRLPMPSEALLSKHLAADPMSACQAAIFKTELRDRCYAVVLNGKSIEAMYNFSISVLNKPDQRLMAAAEALNSRRPEASTGRPILPIMDQFTIWYSRISHT